MIFIISPARGVRLQNNSLFCLLHITVRRIFLRLTYSERENHRSIRFFRALIARLKIQTLALLSPFDLYF